MVQATDVPDMQNNHRIGLAHSAPMAASGAAASTTDLPVRKRPSTAVNPQEAPCPLRVLHVIDRLGIGGTEVGILKVIQGLSGTGFEHRICTIRGFDEDFAHSRGFVGQCYVAGSTEKGFQFLLPRLAKVMRDFRPQIVHSRNWGAIEAMAAARLSGVPVAIHSEHGYEMDMLHGLPLRRRLFRRIAYAAADAVFTVTKELRSYHAKEAWLPAEKLRVLYNGVDTSRFAPRLSGDIRKQLGLRNGNLVLGSVGRITRIKDHLTLLKAAELVSERGIAVQVLLVGSGPELPKLKEYASSSMALAEKVVFAGESADIPALLNAMDVFVLPSISEGMSNTLLEAMASSLPVIATRVGGNPELIEHERSGWLFAPRDVAGLAAILEHAAQSAELRQQLGQVARDRTVRQFSLERMIQNYRDLYFELARKRGVLAAHQE
jgi:sugar transferase (PEP-CTERM/EpsH1 system associated)